ncbi:acyl-[acyl-carrier-protein]-phospholipid O-acyltransferase/long-chain-fatty-acid--[acyl-carrier-protein] ligase [Methylomonas methanica]|uniref:Acyl-[acyl-carrier-protein]-phospholipid O-acyltransferase/long-chain-fatty-acid--[acyl-carrier-protein] ligase n=1 Tax=Methylomonas methanica TaxID=421 RepID=A0ABY2CGB5_METMH|nr:acyl-[acyl-carrier-protein]-phospholipid O-acyltransferase/long-chain-fatty-acid--[acyl-carrier-protein] ligase [Methylomonas methanica]
MLKIVLRWLLTLVYRVKVHGLENYAKAGNRVLIVANHTSFLDPLLLGVFLPDDITFAINTQISERWWLKPFLRLSKVFPMDPTHPLSLKALIHHLQNDTKTVIFPEGRITVTGSLMKIYDGTGMVADKSGATLLPVRIEGAEYSRFSKLGGKVRQQWFPRIAIHIQPPTLIETHGDVTGKARRKHSGHILADIMTEMMFATSHYQQTIFSALLEARALHGGRHTVAEDLERKPISYDALITRSIVVGKLIKAITQTGENVGVLLPNSCKTLNVVLGLQIYQRVPAMLNYSIGAAGMAAACRTGQINIVLTSRKFIELAKLGDEAATLAQHVKLIYLEDLATSLTGFDKLTGLLQAKTARFWYKSRDYDADDAAVVLFTSGSEGLPKGVVLSHANILANHKQIRSRIDFGPGDVVLNFLPMFHSFGFTVGTMMPILNGMTSFFYPSPLHYAVIPEMAYEVGATIMFGTNTFLAAYAKKAHPYDFFSLRYVVAGAEKLQETTRTTWLDKFGIRILEGYGATETSPVTSVNTPMDYKAGSVGRFMPDMLHKLEPVPGIENAGKLHVAGPNIMKGYLLPDNPGVLVPPCSAAYGEGWYDTGDIVHVDEEGFIHIRGRSKRFAKIGGEMVSLTAVEQLAIHA